MEFCSTGESWNEKTMRNSSRGTPSRMAATVLQKHFEVLETIKKREENRSSLCFYLFTIFRFQWTSWSDLFSLFCGLNGGMRHSYSRPRIITI